MADLESKWSQREQTPSPLVVEEKRQPVVASSISSYTPAPRITFNSTANSPPPPKPLPGQTQEDDNEYDSDDASEFDYSCDLLR